MAKHDPRNGRMVWLSVCSRHQVGRIGPYPDCDACQRGVWEDEGLTGYNAERDRRLRPHHYATCGNVSEPYPPPMELLDAYDEGYAAALSDKPAKGE